MDREALSGYANNVAQRVDVTMNQNAAISYVLLVTAILWTGWRYWKFTLYPYLHPDEPKELPYLVPVLGHALDFFRDSNGLLARGRRSFASSDPFALTAFGHTFYVVTNAKQSAEVYKNTNSLSFEEFVQTLMRTNGNDEHTIKTVYSPLPTNKPGYPNPEGLSLGVLAQRMHVHQLHPGENMVVIQEKVRGWINRQLKLDVLAKGSSDAATQGSTPVQVQLPLYEWTSDCFVRLGQYAYFGDVMDQVDPNYPNAYIIFDEVIWKMLYQYPSILCRDMTGPRDQMMASLNAYFKLPPSQRRDQAAWIINAMEDESESYPASTDVDDVMFYATKCCPGLRTLLFLVRALGVDDENLAIMMFHLYFAINTNARKTSFWMLTYLMRNPAYLAAYREETAPAFDGDDLVSIDYIQDSEKCPKVTAIWHETLRIAGWAASVRSVTNDVVIGGKLMRKGNRVMIPHRLLHFDESVFGENTQEWRPERWLNTEAGRKLANSPSWRPFGGGKTKCSGRYLAKYFVTSFVATLLRRFDIAPVGNPPMPQQDVGRPVLGIISVKEGQDYSVSLTKRKSAV